MKIKGREFNLMKVELRVLLAWLAISSGLLLFMFVAALVSRGSMEGIDHKLLLEFRTPGDLSNPIGGKGTLEVMRDITSLGGATVVFLITFLAVIFFLLKKNYSSLILLSTAVIGASIIGLGLKHLFGRVRPELVPQLMYEHSLSFPSGHSFMSAVIYLSLAALLAEAEDSRRTKIFLILSAAFLSIIIGISRIYLGVHNPSDVLAGWAIGTAWASLCWYVAWYIRRRKILKSDGLQ